MSLRRNSSRSMRFALRLAAFALVLAAPSLSAGDDGDEDEKPKPPRTKQPAILLTSVPGRPVPGAGFVQRYGIKQIDIERLRATLASVDRVVTLREITREARYVDQECNVRVIGTTENAPQVIALSFHRGGFFARREVETRNNVAVIGAEVARSLYPGTNPVGRNVRIGTNYFLIVGVLKPTKAGRTEADFDSAVFIPQTTMRSRVNLDNLDVSRKLGSFTARQVEFTQTLITLRTKKAMEETADAIREYFQNAHKKKDVELSITAAAKR